MHHKILMGFIIKNKMVKKKLDMLYVILIVSLIAFLLFMVFWLQDESSKCVKNPVRYFTEKNEHIYCNCYDNNGVFIEGINEEVFNLKTNED